MSEKEKKYRLRFYNLISKENIERYEDIPIDLSYIPYKFICYKFVSLDLQKKNVAKEFCSVRSVMNRYGLSFHMSQSILKTLR